MKKKSTHLAFLDSPLGITLSLCFLFLFRLGFGLCSDIAGDDPRQTYLIGLKYYCTGAWPYFGPDVMAGVQVPGSLEGLLVGFPFKILPLPEAPYLLLNLLSFVALCLLARYYSRRLPGFPQWLLWGWTLTTPWVLNCSTNVFNVSYVLFGSILFFLGFWEALPGYSLNLIPPKLCYFMMGFSFFWNAQFHLSYVILAPFILLAFLLLARLEPSALPIALAFFILGSLVSGAFLLPTYLRCGFHLGTGGTQNTLAFNPSNIGAFFTILARYFSLASCEIPRFIGSHTAERLAFLGQYPWVAPFTIVAGILGIFQVVVLVFSGFRKKNPPKDWPIVKGLTWAAFTLVYAGFLFTVKSPASHTYYLLLPLVLLYAFYAFAPWASNRWFLMAAKILLVCNMVFHFGLALDNLKNRSLYKERDLFAKAIREKNYHLLGERRSSSFY